MPAKKAKENKGAAEPQGEATAATPKATEVLISNDASNPLPHTLENNELPSDQTTIEAPEAKTPKTIPQLAYELFATRVEGDFPDFQTLKPETQAAYNDAAAHVLFGNEPRTDYERTVWEILAPVLG